MANSVEIHNNERHPIHIVINKRNHHMCSALDKGLIGEYPNFVTVSASAWADAKTKNRALQELEDNRRVTVKNVGES